MKKLLCTAVILASTSVALAQNKNFEGFSGSVGLAYTTLGTDFTNFKTAAGRSYTVRTEDSKHVTPQIGLEYTGHVDGNFFLSVGADYQFGKGKTANVFFDGTKIDDTYKGSLKARLYVAPAVAVDNSTLAYFKLGFTSVKADWSDGSSGSEKVKTFGVGVKFLADEKGNYFAEWNSINGKRKSRVDESGNTYALKPTGSTFIFGYNAKF